MNPTSLTAQAKQPASLALPATPKATQSLHGHFLEKSIPAWLTNASAQRREAFKGVTTALPSWFQNATPTQRQTLRDTFKASVVAQNSLDKSMATVQQVEAFARPLLIKALADEYQLQVDVDQTLLCLRRPLEISVLEVEVDSFEVLKLSLLEAALHNFEAWECSQGAYHATSGFVVATTEAGNYEAMSLAISVSQFLGLCRRLDIGKQYQTWLQSFFHPADPVAEAVLRERFIASQKATMRAAAEQALLTKDIEAAHYAMIVSVIEGELNPSVGNKPVWFCDFSLMKKRMTGCVVFVISEKYRYASEWIVYIPHDPEHPFKCYRGDEDKKEFKRLLTARSNPSASGAEPTAYQRFLSQFLPYDQRGDYFSQFTRKAGDSPSDFWRSPWRIVTSFGPGAPFTRIKQLPPPPAAKLEPEPDPYIAPGAFLQRQRGLWEKNQNLWQYLYNESRAKVLADARSHAVPTDDVDVKAREARLAHLMQIGLLGLNMVSMFVPVLGEVMMVVMAGQLLYETLEGAIEWGEGDRRAAKDHLIDVAENLAQIALMAGVGAGVRKISSAKAVPVIEQLQPVQLPNGETRLWRAGLQAYESAVTLPDSPGPNLAGQHVFEGKTYIRQGGKAYEQFFDDSIGKWRIRHPSDANAWQPVLDSNGHGAWRHTLERPHTWDRLTLLRRIGHATEAFSDAQLLKAADISGVSDAALRKMHIDSALPPPELTQAMRVMQADSNAARVVEQLRGTQPIDDLYLYALPLITEMPRWPANRVLEVFDGEALSGKSVRYGSVRRFRNVGVKTPIQISRADVLSGKLPAHILAALDESEVTGLLGEQGARVRDARPAEFGKQIANYADTRQPAIYDSIYLGKDPIAPQVVRLQKACPGLSEPAAQTVLAHARLDDLERLGAGQRVPLRLLEEARWYARQSRQVAAYAGLRSENVASADSRRLALHTLEQLPGWADNVRIEVREGHEAGMLLDSIGSETAGEKKYLIKKGMQFEAFNERGEALNSLPRNGDNFYSSIMHALPDQARRSLGVPEVGQSARLRTKIIDYADQHQADAPALLAPQVKWIKPPVRVNAALIGYPASGRGAGVQENLVAHVRDIYPQLSYEQVQGFILEQYRAGQDDSAIFELLQARRREWEQLNATLDEWAGTSTLAPWERSGTDHKFRAAQALKTCWRNALSTGVAGADQLSILTYDPLPVLTADFAHVRELSIGGNGLTDANADAFLARFANVQKLSLGERGSLFGTYMAHEQALTTLPLTVTRMSALKKLKFRTQATVMAADLSTRLRTLTAVEELHLDLTSGAGMPPGLDLAPLRRMKKLKIEAPGLTQWPAYVEQLPELERLDLTQTAIASLPQTLYVGHEKLWAGLSLDWSKFSHEAFKPVYDYVKNYMGQWQHLVDLDSMVRSYCGGELQFLTGEAGRINPLPERIMNLWNTPETRLKAVEILRVEHSAIFRQFYEATATGELRTAMPAARWQTPANARVMRALEQNWRAAIRRRYRLPDDVRPYDAMDLPSGAETGDAGVFEVIDTAWTLGEDAVSELPQLPAGTFAHVRSVRLDRLNVPIEQVRGFLQAFSGTTSLEVTACGLTEVPVRPADVPQLTRLDVSLNRIIVTPDVQAQFDALSKLEHLNARLNQLDTLDVSRLTGLKTLNLSSNGFNQWPTGAQSLPRLQLLDLRHNTIGSLPEDVLANDTVLLKTRLLNNRFNVTGAAALKTAQGRIEMTIGLPEGALQRFDAQAAPLPGSIATPQESALDRAGQLLPLPPASALGSGADMSARVLEIFPSLTLEQAQVSVARLRDEGLSAEQVADRLNQWRASNETLTRELNGWIFGATQGFGERAPSSSRLFDATRIRTCWRDGLTAHTESAGQTLSLAAGTMHELPALSTLFSHVRTLDLTGAKFSVDSFNLFCPAFPELTTLRLNGNALERLPEAVGRLNRLERLELSGNRLALAQTVYQHASGTRLRWLDLSHNQLEEFDAAAFSRLETLNLSHNGLDFWPGGVLELAHLQKLDLSDNNIMVFPDRLLGGNHERLVAGADLSDNSLSLNALEQLRDYSAAQGGGNVMGYTPESVQGLIDERVSTSDSGSGSDPGSDSDSDDSDDPSGPGDGGARRMDTHAGVEAAEVIADPAQDVAPPAMETWMTFTHADARAARQALWQQLAGQVNHESFFHLLSTLPDTLEFRLSGADLTHRVWQVIEAATENAELRDLLFLNAETHGTCGDGRILSFSELETRVYEYNALRDVPRQRPEQRGRALLDLTRRLFRLERVDRLAEAAARNKDRAEVRLQYRIGMIRGWPDGLELPAQPEHMLYATPIRGQRLLDARAAVLADEASDRFLEDLIGRDYWIRYLRERNPEVFETLESNASRRQEEVEDLYPDKNDNEATRNRYLEAMAALEIELAEARIEKLIELSRAQMQSMAPVGEGAAQPAPSSPQPGPSWRP
ncbi:NEL-type E3 ubiquitin ligase domain-containing protein [Pseudomonas koreensis]|uniref:NEL-type E3 ubiquitin ligase domain-containing protein n=1 Tax=Pseudomonas koreensis TaxID=198620 RepID=UPI002FCC4503